MVLLAAAVLTKKGKVIISRQFVEMTKARIEGLLAAFPKLMSTGKQHTFVETDFVRYMYQPIESLYVVLITTKTSNILEDLETLRLFAKVVPEYCHCISESEVTENAFNLIFAFDEIVALGYRESVNLAQIRTYVEMDSHEEKVYQALRQSQEREAKNKMREKAKELHRQRMDAKKFGGKAFGSSGGGFGSGSSFVTPIAVETAATNKAASVALSSKSSETTATPVPVKALKLGGKAKNVDTFMDQINSEGNF